MKFISKVKDLKGKVVLLRLDINSDVVNGKVLESERIKEASKSVIFLKKKGAKVVILAHQGRPGGEDFTSLEKHSKFLSKYTKVKYVNDIYGRKAEKEVKELRDGEAILLDNVRKVKEEMEGKECDMTRVLSSLTDIYVNDAFSNCHRAHSSIVVFPKIMKSYGGILLERELRALGKIKIKGALYVLGGAKPEDNIKLMGKNRVLGCGLFGQTCLYSRGFKFGAQEGYLKKAVKDFEKVAGEIKKKMKNVQTPVDFAVKVNGKRKELLLKEFPSQYEIYDIGNETQKKFVSEIKKAKAIYMKGPAGFTDDKKFAKGTNEILRAISQSRAFSVIGGGHLSDAIARSKIPINKFGHVSLSGGALLSYIAGEKLPGLEALEKNK